MNFFVGATYVVAFVLCAVLAAGFVKQRGPKGAAIVIAFFLVGGTFAIFVDAFAAVAHHHR